MPEMGKNAKERNKSIGDLISELNIIREQLRHPNVVRYYKTFEESKSNRISFNISVFTSQSFNLLKNDIFLLLVEVRNNFQVLYLTL